MAGVLEEARAAVKGIPFEVRTAVMQRARHACEDCLCGDVALEVHHLRYFTGLFHEPIDGRETPDDLAVLCRDCHHARHLDPNGQFWRDPGNLSHQRTAWIVISVLNNIVHPQAPTLQLEFA